MDVSESSLPDSINPNNFPAKLWRLVNNPVNTAICWDTHGQIIVVDQPLFEREILGHGSLTTDNADAFKTTNFSSFVRQLNLYGFKKAESAIKSCGSDSRDNAVFHYFYNPNFKRNQPELVANLRRLTVDNKAKIKAGQDVKNRPPTRYLRYSGGDDGSKNVKRGSVSLLSPTLKESTHPYYPAKGLQPLAAHNGTPVPPRFLMRGRGAALSPSVFGVASNSNAIHIQQGLLARANNGNPNFPFNPPNAQYPPGYYTPVCQCYHPNLVASHMAGSGLQAGAFSPHSFYQAGYPVNMLCHLDQDSKNKEHQEVKKQDVNLDTIFQIADEVMQTPPSSSLVRVMTAEELGTELVPLPANAVLWDNPASSMKANPLCTGPVMSVSSEAHQVVCKQQDRSVVSVPVQLPEDAIFEVTTDDAKDSEVSEDLWGSSQASSSTCTGSSADL